MDLVILLICLLTILILYRKYCLRYWTRRNVPQLEPSFLKGNSRKIFSLNPHIGTEGKYFYDEIKKLGCKYGGIYLFTQPALVIADPEYAKDILQRDFYYFPNRSMYFNEKSDPVTAHLFSVNVDKWKPLRAKLTPTFTSGKMKMMFHLVKNCSNQMVNAVKEMTHMDIDVKNITANFSMDVIGSCAYGIECNSFKDPNAKFLQMGLAIQKFSIMTVIRTHLIQISPTWSKILNVRRFSKYIGDFYIDITRSTIQHREKNNITRPDFLQLLIELKNRKENSLTMNEIAANVFLFFIAGFDTSSTVMQFAIYELAKHQEFQDKLRLEINSVVEQYNNEITYDSLNEMKYLDQVVNETLRKYPPVPTINRVCTKRYTLRDTSTTIEPGTTILIPAIGLHYDAEYYPEPNKFDPERFSSENKLERHSFLHLPFGEGPRNCIGLRFGIMQTKIGLISIIRNFKLNPSPMMKEPIHFNDKLFLLQPIEKVLVKMESIL